MRETRRRWTIQGTQGIRGWWRRLATRHALLAEMARFSGLSFMVAALQYGLLTFLPVLLFATTGWGAIPAQLLHVQAGPLDTYVFDYPVTGDATGGMSYFIAFALMLVISQGVNFPLQRTLVFRSTGNVWLQLAWCALALVVITMACSLLMSLYVPVLQQHVAPAAYNVLVTMINGAVQLVVYFPVFRIIFPAAPAAAPAVQRALVAA